MATQTQAETFNEDLRQTRVVAAPTRDPSENSDVRLSEVSSATNLLRSVTTGPGFAPKRRSVLTRPERGNTPLPQQPLLRIRGAIGTPGGQGVAQLAAKPLIQAVLASGDPVADRSLRLRPDLRKSSRSTGYGSQAIQRSGAHGGLPDLVLKVTLIDVLRGRH
ncbi:hypothetical protein GCM10010109_11450 [Actinoplanes campanulatus]|nr:hypothetical protein GCM10010109_11450 [Actinoplanes campanulatus]GID35299.1 hypothetical protein Aca09nite_18050 [Actinoplanes campanulatus]